MNRITEMDALRGFALFGILLVNIFVFHAPLFYYGEVYGVYEGVEATTVFGVVNFAGGKFMLIFAFLFGYGIVLQEKSQQQAFQSYFLKRMAVLFMFGALHILIFWFGDILASYALLGFLVLPILKCSNRTILVTGIVFIMFRSLYYFVAIPFGLSLIPIDQPESLNYFMEVFQEGTYAEVFVLRMKEFIAFIPENLVWYIPKTFGLFLLGIYAARKMLFTGIRNHVKQYAKLAFLFISLGTLWMFYKSDLFALFNLDAQPLWRPVLIGFNVLFETLLGIGYIIGFNIFFQKNKVLRNVFSKAGRLALTNYILQSLLCVAIFYAYGLGYYGKLKPTNLVLIAILVFGVNLIFSHNYLKYKKMGPLEYLWRKLIRKGKLPNKN